MLTSGRVERERAPPPEVNGSGVRESSTVAAAVSLVICEVCEAEEANAPFGSDGDGATATRGTAARGSGLVGNEVHAVHELHLPHTRA